MWVKICGLTKKEDAFAAAELGADAIGFVFTKSKRRADPDDVCRWIHEIEGVEKVGVFTDETAKEIMKVADRLKLDAVQIHSAIRADHFSLADKFKIIVAVSKLEPSCNTFNSNDIAYSFRSAADNFSKGDENSFEITFKEMAISFPCRVLIDPSMGTGGRAEWKPYQFDYILAGGLTPENVHQAISKAHPSGVDVSSGIEISPGIKDINKMKKFISEAKS